MNIWTWRDDLRLFRYNWIKRPWRNFVWRAWLTQDRWDWQRAHPGRKPITRLGKMDRSDIEWARGAVADGALERQEQDAGPANVLSEKPSK